MKPELHYLRDKDGRLVPVPGFGYEDFLDLIKLKQRSEQAEPAGAPDYSLQQLVISGEAHEQSAELTVRFDIRVRRGAWVRVPLGMGGAALDGAADYEGPGDYLLSYDDASDQHIAWIRGSPGTNHRLTFKAQTALVGGGIQQKLSLSLPRAATSRFSLSVRGGNVRATAAPNTLSPEVTAEGETSVISVLGVGGDFSLSWLAAPSLAAQSESVLESSGAILVKIDGRSVTSDATLTVRSFGSPFDKFRVKLPKGAVLTGGEQAGYTLLAAGSMGDPLVEVRLDKPTVGPVEVKFVTERAYDVTRPETLELAGFQVVEAAAHRQGGQIGVVVSGDWQVVWESRSRVRQIDEPVEALRRRDLLAAFEYVGQPCSLAARVVVRRSRISVDPEYVYYVDAYQSRLEARLRYSIRGAKVFALELGVPGWDIDEVGPANVVDLKSVVADEAGHVRIPLAQPTVGEVEITLRARLPHANSDELELNLPVLADAIAGPSTVVIVPAANVELATKTDELVALSAQRAPASLEIAHRFADALVFRGERAAAKFAAGMTVRSQRTTVQITSTAEAHKEGVDVTQRFEYHVFYEPVGQLGFSMPRTLVARDGIDWFVNGQPVTAQLVADERESADGVRWQLEVPEPQIGSLNVSCRYELPSEELRPGASSVLEVPLVMPLEGEFGGNTLELQCEAGLTAEPRAGHWKLVDQKVAGGEATLRLAAATAASSAAFTIVVEDRPGMGAIIERAWVQTWMTEQTRQERAVFSIAASEPQLSLMLPDDASASDAEVFVDGQAVRPTVRNENDLEVEWPADGEVHVLEVRYRYLNPEGGSAVAFRSPSLGQGAHVRRMYWQLMVPRDWHLLTFAAGLAPEFSWQFGGLNWSRRNVLDQADLEEWTGTLREAPPPDAINEYLLSVIGNDPSLEVRLGRRSTIVFSGSLAVLGLALLLLYAPWLRTAQALVVGGAVLLVVALAYPGPAIVLGQGAALGIVLAIFAAALHRSMTTPTAGAPLPPPHPSSILERTTTGVYPRAAAAAPSSSTAAALALERSSSESEVR
jgi:hypothetical protein